MHAIAMVHKMQRLALSSSSMIAAPIQEEGKQEAAITEPLVSINHTEQVDDGIDDLLERTQLRSDVSTASGGCPNAGTTATDGPASSIAENSANGSPATHPMDL